MKTFIIFALLVFAASHLPSQESGVSRAQLLPYTGIYDMEKQKDVIVSLHSVGGSHVLVLTDLRNDNFRALFPAGKDLFIAGKELLKPEPVEYRIQFEWNNTGKIAKLRIHSAASNDQDQIGQKEYSNFTHRIFESGCHLKRRLVSAGSQTTIRSDHPCSRK